MIVKNESRAVIRASGADAAQFLQGQLCNNIDTVSQLRGQLSALSSPKGRVLAVFRVMADDNGWWLSLPACLAEDTTRALRRYVLRSKVSLAIDPDTITAVTACRLPDGITAPDGMYACSRANELVAMRLPGAAPLFEIVGPADRFATTLTQADHGNAALATVSAGLPDVVPATAGAFVAQMLNLDKLDGISFTKGCYTGQEVIARTQNLGRIKRRMFRYTGGPADTTPQPGDAVHAAGDSAGKVVSVAGAGESGFELLAVMRLDTLDAGGIALADGTPLTAADLPSRYA